VPVTVHVDADVLAGIEASGSAHVNAVLREVVRQGKLAAS